MDYVMGNNMKDRPAVSVVVPVYNVEEYLEQCVNSILNQDFGNFELLIIDDGSTDESGNLCEELARRDKRIRCFHKENGGLSDARNFGIDRMRGDLVTFVDSDDWLEPDCLSYLYNAICSTDAEISTCVYLRVSESGSKPWRSLPVGPEVMSGRDALLSLFYDEKINVSAHGKLYKSRLFEDIRYPLGKRYEDVGTTYRLLAKAQRVAVGGLPLYNYRMRPGSITHEGSDGLFDRCELAEIAYKEISEYKDDELTAAAECYMTFHELSVLRSYKPSCLFDYDRAMRLKERVLERKKRVIKNVRAPRLTKYALEMLEYGLHVYRLAWLVFSFVTGRRQ